MAKLPPLYQAAIAGDVDRVKKLLTKTWYRTAVDINGADTDRGFSPLHRAIETKQNRVVRFLLRHRPPANVNLCFAGVTPLDMAIKKNNAEAIGWLKELGAKTAQELKQRSEDALADTPKST